MNLHIKTFEQLTSTDLYEILKLRSAVFVVEQNCVYQDIDGGDYESVHLYYEEDGQLLSYLRVYMQDEEQKIARIGRVISAQRGVGLGAKILQAGIAAAKEELQADSIFIEAQSYAIGFYEKAGFRLCGEEFLEDGIPHVPMTLNLN